MKVVVTVDNLLKKFKIYDNPWHRAREWLSLGKRRRHQEFTALKNISFQVEAGECFGIIGPNGAGKSTLLKILTRALLPTGGSFRIEGRVLSLLELGTGFNPELTGRQNLYNSAMLLGFPEKYISGRLTEIEDFAGLGPFITRPVKLYSTGMYVRLAFSMFVFLEPDVLIVDEALSVGDIFFQQKCFAKIREIIARGTTCLFVSHDTAVIQNLCQRAMLLHHGENVFTGAAPETVSRYFGALASAPAGGGATTGEMAGARQSFESAAGSAPGDNKLMASEMILAGNILTKAVTRHGARGLEIIAALVIDAAGRHTFQVEMMAKLKFHLLLQANEIIEAPNAGIHLIDRLGNLVFAAGTRQLHKDLPRLAPGERLIVTMELQLNVQPGEYTFSLGGSEPAAGEEGPNIGYLHDRCESLGPIVVVEPKNQLYPFYGIARLPMTVDYFPFGPDVDGGGHE